MMALGLRIYSTSFRNCHFIFLDSCDFNTPEDWTGQFPPFEKQMDYLRQSQRKKCLKQMLEKLLKLKQHQSLLIKRLN